MNNWLLLPPVAFLVILAVMLIQLRTLGFLSATGKKSDGKRKAYACGEDVKNHHVQPDYSQFFVFAFFFTLMHVVALIVATVPKSGDAAGVLDAMYLVCAVVALAILFRR